MRFHRPAAAVVAGLFLASVLFLVPTASAEPTGETPGVSPLSALPATMWQTDQTVWALAYSQNVLYVGGSFNSVRPPGAALGAPSQQAQASLAAFNATTGAFISSWRPVIGGGEVFALDVSPDGSRLYVGGDFTAVNSQSHPRMAAFDITTPTSPVLLNNNQFGARTNGRVTDIDSTDDSVWAGGRFTTAGAVNRSYVAAFDAQGGAVLPFEVELTGVSAPSYNAPFVTAVEVNANGARVAVGGLFDNVDGVPQHGLAVLNAVTGNRVTTFAVPGIINTSFVTAAAFSAGRLFIAGRDDKSGSTNRLEGVMALNASNGAILWGSDQHRCLGDSFALQVLAGSVWVGTHAHNCSNVGGYPESTPRFYGSVLGQQVASGEQNHFYPDTTGRPSVPGSLNNVRALATDGSRLFVGGGFASINGVQQQNVTAFGPKAAGGAAPTRVGRPTATTDSTGRATVTWTASSDLDDRTLTYSVFRRNSTTPFQTLQADSAFWNRPQLSVVDPGVGPGDTVFYKVRVTDGGNASTSLASNTITIPAAPASYKEAVLADGPDSYWRFNDASGSATAADSSASASDPGTGVGGPVFDQDGALSGGNGAALFNGSSEVYSSVARTNPSTYSMELWFTSSSVTGGKLVGLGSSTTGVSAKYDRHIYLTDAGRIVFGVHPGSAVTVTSPTAFNDGSWHHVVATQGATGMNLYVDGSLVGSDAQAAAQDYTGYIRVGGDNLNRWPSRPSSDYVTATIDEAAYYPSVLDAAQVARHYDLR